METIEEKIKSSDERGVKSLRKLWDSKNSEAFMAERVMKNSKKTLLMLAARRGRLECVRFLLRVPQPNAIDHQDHHGFTALHHASYHGNEKCVWLLLESGALILLNNSLEDAADAAMVGYHFELSIKMRESKYFLPANHPPPDTAVATTDAASEIFDFTRDFMYDLSTKKGMLGKTDSVGNEPSQKLPSSSDPYGDPSIGAGAPADHSSSSVSRADAAKMFLEVVSVLEGGDETLLGNSYCCLASEQRKAAGSSSSGSAGSSSAEDLMIGRSRANDVCLLDLSVSKEHAVLAYYDGLGFVVRDCGSKHGSFVDGERLRPGQSPLLVVGMHVRFGLIKCEVKRRRQAAVLSSGFQPSGDLRRQQIDELRKKCLLENAQQQQQLQQQQQQQQRGGRNKRKRDMLVVSEGSEGREGDRGSSDVGADADRAAASRGLAVTSSATSSVTSSSSQWRDDGARLLRKLGGEVGEESSGGACTGGGVGGDSWVNRSLPVNAVKRVHRAGLGCASAVVGTVESLCQPGRVGAGTGGGGSAAAARIEMKEFHSNKMIERFKELDRRKGGGGGGGGGNP